MNWQWLVDEGLISGDPDYYASGKAKPTEVNNAIKVAYAAATPAQRKVLVDMLWESGKLEGDKTYWYEDRGDEVNDLATAYSGVSSDAPTGTGEETQPRFGVAGGAKLWKNITTGEIYIVYMVPGTEDDPVYMRWTVSEEDAKSFFGPDQPVVYEYQISSNNPLWASTIDFGSGDEIANTSENPFDTWASTMEVEAASQPWLLDDDYQTLLAMAIIEGRVLTEAEIKSTRWWQDHTAAERGWMELYHGDPSEAARRIADNRLRQADLFRQAGLLDFDDGLINFFADKVTMGIWSVDYAQSQIDRLADPYYASEPIDQELAAYMEDNNVKLGQTVGETDRVRQLVKQWLGPNFGSWSDETINYWAGRLRNEEDAEIYLIETLKDQKEAMFPQYGREADFNTMAQPWRSYATSFWGFTPQDDDETLMAIIQANNADTAAQTLRTVGLERGYDRVVNDIDQSMRQGMRANVRGAV
jgi:hypothetical protein